VTQIQGKVACQPFISSFDETNQYLYTQRHARTFSYKTIRCTKLRSTNTRNKGGGRRRQRKTSDGYLIKQSVYPQLRPKEHALCLHYDRVLTLPFLPIEAEKIVFPSGNATPARIPTQLERARNQEFNTRYDERRANGRKAHKSNRTGKPSTLYITLSYTPRPSPTD
jgi:hypothetical protein